MRYLFYTKVIAKCNIVKYLIILCINIINGFILRLYSLTFGFLFIEFKNIKFIFRKKLVIIIILILF